MHCEKDIPRSSLKEPDLVGGVGALFTHVGLFPALGSHQRGPMTNFCRA